jgi:hypothetical protein
MAKFCETLAETGIVVDACLAAGKGRASAYALRHRDPLFAAAWEAALGLARVQLSDALLARSIEGSVESFYRDGELVGEKRYFDNRLGLAVLKRLDRVAETGSPIALPAHQSSVRAKRSRSAPAPRPVVDWDQMIGALRTGEPGAIAIALAALKEHEPDETDKTDTPPDSSFSGGEDEIEEGSDRVWQSHDDWWTDFPPPAGFNGVEHGIWGRYGYKRVCTDEEIALLDAVHTNDRADERAAQETERNAFFAEIAAELAAEAEQEEDSPSPSC